MERELYPQVTSRQEIIHGQLVTVRVFAPQLSVNETLEVALHPSIDVGAMLRPNINAVSFQGRIQPLAWWAKEVKIPFALLRRRWEACWDITDMLTIRPGSTEEQQYA